MYVCLCVCQHDNFQTSKHRMMKDGGRCIVQKSRPSSNLAVIVPLGAKCGVRLRRWDRLSSLGYIMFASLVLFCCVNCYKYIL